MAKRAKRNATAGNDSAPNLDTSALMNGSLSGIALSYLNRQIHQNASKLQKALSRAAEILKDRLEDEDTIAWAITLMELHALIARAEKNGDEHASRSLHLQATLVAVARETHRPQLKNQARRVQGMFMVRADEFRHEFNQRKKANPKASDTSIIKAMAKEKARGKPKYGTEKTMFGYRAACDRGEVPFVIDSVEALLKKAKKSQ